jgi:transcriptional regulator with XRE-family HTH domain
MTSEDVTPGSDELLPEQRVGIAMREVRESRGVSLRQMAKRLNYSSHTTLSGYERGSVMPTDQVVEGYERLLGLESGALSAVLESARVERHGDAWHKRRVHLPVEFVNEAALPTPEFEPHGRRFAGWPRKRVIFVGAATTVLLAAVGAVGLATLTRDTPETEAVEPQLLVPDGSDPKVTGCADGAVTASSIEIHDPPQYLAGVLELRTSVRCGTSWGRFTPSATLAVTPPLTIVIAVHRPADGTDRPFQLRFDGQAVYGDMLISRHQCVYATLTLRRDGKEAPTVRTECRLSPGSS